MSNWCNYYTCCFFCCLWFVYVLKLCKIGSKGVFRLPRFQVSVSEELNDFVGEEAKRIGITKSSYVATLIAREKRNVEAIQMTSDAKHLFDAYQRGDMDDAQSKA